MLKNSIKIAALEKNLKNNKKNCWGDYFESDSVHGFISFSNFKYNFNIQIEFNLK
jgi:hypothetical protein